MGQRAQGSMKYTMLIIGTIGAAVGLNLSVMSLGEPPATVAAQSDAPVESEVLAAGAENGQDGAPLDAATPGGAAAELPMADSASSTEVPATQVPATGAPADPTATTKVADPTATGIPPTSAPAGTAAATSTSTPRPPATATTGPTPKPSPTTAPGETEFLYYEWAGIASQIVIAVHDGTSLEFWSVTPASGWQARVLTDSPSRVSIRFRPAGEGDEGTWEITMQGGQPRIKKEF